MKKRCLASPPRLVPEVVELIARYIPQQYDMAMLLWVLPHEFLSEALQSMQQLFLALYCGRLGKFGIGTTECIELWPTLKLPYPIHEPQIIKYMANSLELYSHIDLDWVADKLYIPSTTWVSASLASIKDINLAIRIWPSRLISIGVEILESWSSNDVVQMCKGIELLPSLKEFDVSWKQPQEKFHCLLKAIATSSISKIALRFDRDRAMEWTELMVDEFTAWFRENQVKDATFQHLRILEASTQKFCQAILNKSDLKALTISDGILARDVFFYGKLPQQLTTLVVHDAHYADLPIMSRCIDGANLHKLELTFRMSERRKDENIVKFVAETLPSLKSLRVLDLPHFAMTPTAYPALISIAPQLEVLNLETGHVKTLEGVLALAGVLHKCTRLKTLKLCTPACGEQGAAALAAGLINCHSLAHLTLRGCQIRTSGAKTIAATIASCPNLVELNLSSNSIGTQGAIALSEVIPKCKLLKELYLKTNGIESNGARALSQVLPQLSVADLGLNHIDAEGAVAIGIVLPLCVNLSWLSLHYNPLGLQGALAIISGTAKSPYRCGRIGISYSIEKQDESEICRQAISRLLYPDWIVF